MAAAKKSAVKRPVGRPPQPTPKIDASFEKILKSVVTLVRKGS